MTSPPLWAASILGDLHGVRRFRCIFLQQSITFTTMRTIEIIAIKFNQDHQTCNQGERGAQERTVGQFKKSWRRQRAYVVFDDDDLVVLEDHVVKDDDNYVVLDEHVVIDDDIYVVFDHHFVSSVRSSNSHPDLLVTHQHPTFFLYIMADMLNLKKWGAGGSLVGQDGY